MTNIMVSFDKDGVEVGTLSDNNSVLHNIEVYSSVTNRQVTYDNTPYAINNNQGLGVLVINGSTFAYENFATFDVLTNIAEVDRFIMYIKSIAANKVVVITSCGHLASNKKLDDFFVKIGSSCWFNTFFFSGPKAFCGYAAILNTNTKSIINEYSSFNNQDATLSVVFDDINDIGATGTSKPIAIDWTEYKTNGSTVFHEYASFDITSTFIKAGAHFIITGDLKSTTTAIGNKNYSTIALQQFNRNTLVDETILPVNTKPDVWETSTVYATIVPSVTKIKVVAIQKRELNAAITGDVFVKNVIVTQVSRKPNEDKSTSFSQYAIRSKSIEETNPVLQLLGISSSNDINASNIKERESPK